MTSHNDSSADICDQLRDWSSDFIDRNPLLDAAADEIERLRKHKRLQAEDIMTLGQEVGRLTGVAQTVGMRESMIDKARWALCADCKGGGPGLCTDRCSCLREAQVAVDAVLAAQPPAAPVDSGSMYGEYTPVTVRASTAPVDILPSQHREASKWPSKADMEDSHSHASADTGELKAALCTIFDLCESNLASEGLLDRIQGVAENVLGLPSAKGAPAAPQGAWQPIETAPKDGTEVLVWCDEGLDIARYSDRVEDAPDDMGHDAGWWGIRQPMDPGRSMGNPDYMRPAENQPWAWMPKPEAPYDDEGEPLFHSSPKLPFHDETMDGLDSLTIRPSSVTRPHGGGK